MEARVGRSEEDMRDVKATLGRFEPMLIRIDAQLQATPPHLATKPNLAEVQTELRSDVNGLQSAIADKLPRTYLGVFSASSSPPTPAGSRDWPC